MDVTLLFFICMSSLHMIFATITVEVEPRETTLAEGQTLTMMCRANQPISYCKWWFGTDKYINLLERQGVYLPLGFKYHGKGIENGECGMTIPNVTEKHHGVFTCSIHYYRDNANRQLLNEITVIIAKAPKAPQISVTAINPVNEVYPEDIFKENTMILAKCKIEFGRPAANISWFIGNKPITSGLSSPVIENLEYIYNGQKRVKQNLAMMLKRSHNGKDLRCVANHIALGNGTLNHPTYKFTVYFKPKVVKQNCIFNIGKPGLVELIIDANPKPYIEWLVDGYRTLEGAVHRTGRFRAAELTGTGRMSWTAVLNILKIRFKDSVKKFKFTAGNVLGQTEYSGLFCPDT